MTSQIKSMIIKVDVLQAYSFLELNTLPFQRTLRQYHVKYLALMMHRGTFAQGTINFAVTLSGTYLVNGQHTLNAIISSGLPQELSVVYHYVSDDDLPVLYASFDRGLTRTHTDTISMYDIFGDEGFSKTFVGHVSSGLDLVATGFAPDTAYGSNILNLLRSSAIRAELIREWKKEARFFYYDVYSLLGGLTSGQKAMFSRKPIIALALVTYRYNKNLASQFWHGAVKDDALKKGDPRKTLIYFLVNTPRMTYPPHIYSKYIVTSWNAFYHKKEINQLKVYQESRGKPIQIEGTPHRRHSIMAYIDRDAKILHRPIKIDES